MTTKRWLLLVAVAFVAGWLISDWRRDSLLLAVSDAAAAAGDKATAAALAQSAASARILEDRLEALRNARPKEIRTEVVKPVFTNVCLSAEFVSMYNAAAGEIDRTLSGKFKNQMPGDNTAH